MNIFDFLRYRTERLFTDYCKNTAGAIAIIFALMVPVIVGMVGLAVDFASSNHVRQRLCSAIDASALAAAASSTDSYVIEQKVKAFFEANYPEDTIGVPATPVVSVTSDYVQVTASATYYTTFSAALGRTEMNISCSSKVKRDVRGIEVVLVLDVTGSMGNSNMAALRTATKSFVEILYNKTSSPESVKVGIVPYAVTVNLGTMAGNSLYVDDSSLPSGVSLELMYSQSDINNNYNTNEWHGCVMARTPPYDEQDVGTAIGGDWIPYWWADPRALNWSDTNNNNWDSAYSGSMQPQWSKQNNRRTPNLGCPEYNHIVPLTNDETALISYLDNLIQWHRGGTLGNLGMIWGVRVISPEEPYTEGSEYDDSRVQKVIVMMTDGNNQVWKKGGIYTNSDYSAYGYVSSSGPLGTNSRTTAMHKVNDKFARICTYAKSKGVKIYTVVFKSSASSNTKLYYQNCASKSENYHYAPSESDLIDTFEEISEEISVLHITE